MTLRAIEPTFAEILTSCLRHPCRSWILATLALFCLSLQAPGEDARLPVAPVVQPVITKIADLRALSPEEAEENLPVRITGTITYLDPERNLNFIQDETGGSYFSASLLEGAELPDGRPPMAGDVFEISGLSRQGGFAPYLGDGAFAAPRFLGREPLPRPVNLDPENFLDPQYEARRVRTKAFVRSYSYEDSRLSLNVRFRQNSFAAVVQGEWPESFLKKLPGALVELRGVYSGLVDQESGELRGVRLLVAQQWQFLVEEDGFERAFEQLPVETNAFLRHQASASGLIHIQGTLLARGPQGNYFVRAGKEETPVAIDLLDEGSGEPEKFPRGTFVQVAGSPTIQNGHPAVEAAEIRMFRSADIAMEPKALPASFTGRPWRGEWVRTEARLVDRFTSGAQVLLLLNDGSRTFSAACPEALAEFVSKLELNSWLQVTGLLFTGSEDDGDTAVLGARTPAYAGPANFKIWIPQASDISVLREPPFWTTGRFIVLIGLIAALLLASFLWTAIMRRRIAAQTKLIEAKVQNERITEERERIARELHDSIEQGMAALGLQLDLARTTDDPKERGETLSIAHRLLRRTQTETRRSIQDLHDRLLDRTSFANALRILGERIKTEFSVPIKIEIDDLSFAVPGRVAQNILRIAQEAMSNALRHGGEDVRLCLSQDDDQKMVLTVSDNGLGFEPHKRHPGHFGVVGMKDRARRVGARLDIETAPGKGTLIRLTWQKEAAKTAS